MGLQQMSPILLLLPPLVWGHGAMIEPPSRNVESQFGFDNPFDDDWRGLNCGGTSFQFNSVNKGRCGICGDPWDANPAKYQAGGKFANGIIVRNYSPGEVIDVVVWLTANHKGYFTFRLCKNDDVTKAPEQSCFDEGGLLKLEPSGHERFLATGMGSTNLTMKLRLPDITCEQCILQWTYRGGNNWGACKETTFETVGCEESCEGNGGCKECKVGEGAAGCGQQEHFRNCADISITAPASNLLGSSSPCAGEDSCCNIDNPCEVNHGDCDEDADCMEGLKCGKDNCPTGSNFDASDDCCYDPDPKTTTQQPDPETTTKTAPPTTCPVCDNITPIDCNCNCNCNCN